MASFGALSVPMRDLAGRKHQWRPTYGTTPLAENVSMGWRGALVAASYSCCLARGAQHLRTPLLLSLQSISGQRAAGQRWPCHRGACWPLFPRHPRVAGAGPRLLSKPQLVAAARFPACVLPLALSPCQIGSVPRIYLLAFQAERHYKQLT